MPERPRSSWKRTMSRIATSSTSRRSAVLISFFLRRSRASSRACGRRKLPTWSARKGGRVRADIGILLGAPLMNEETFVVKRLRRKAARRRMRHQVGYTKLKGGIDVESIVQFKRRCLLAGAAVLTLLGA